MSPLDCERFPLFPITLDLFYCGIRKHSRICVSFLALFLFLRSFIYKGCFKGWYYFPHYSHELCYVNLYGLVFIQPREEQNQRFISHFVCYDISLNPSSFSAERWRHGSKCSLVEVRVPVFASHKVTLPTFFVLTIWWYLGYYVLIFEKIYPLPSLELFYELCSEANMALHVRYFLEFPPFILLSSVCF